MADARKTIHSAKLLGMDVFFGVVSVECARNMSRNLLLLAQHAGQNSAVLCGHTHVAMHAAHTASGNCGHRHRMMVTHFVMPPASVEADLYSSSM